MTFSWLINRPFPFSGVSGRARVRHSFWIPVFAVTTSRGPALEPRAGGGRGRSKTRGRCPPFPPGERGSRKRRCTADARPVHASCTVLPAGTTRRWTPPTASAFASRLGFSPPLRRREQFPETSMNGVELTAVMAGAMGFKANASAEIPEMEGDAPFGCKAPPVCLGVERNGLRKPWACHGNVVECIRAKADSACPGEAVQVVDFTCRRAMPAMQRPGTVRLRSRSPNPAHRINPG